MKGVINKKIIYIAPSYSTFVNNDIVLLSKTYNVIPNVYSWNKKHYTPFYMFKQFVFLLIHLHSLKVIIISFGGYWSFVPTLIGKMFRIPVLIILNGTDCVSFPELNYGDLRNPYLRFIIKKSYDWAEILLPVSKSLVETKNTYYSNEVLNFGYLCHLPKVKTEYKVVPNGIDFNKWYRDKDINRDPKSFITVLGKGQLKRKGVFLILKLAKRFPNCKFYFVGISDLEGYKIENNVTCLGRLDSIELRKWYNKVQFYLQLSNFEGFGVALCEAMLCECIPIGSSVNHIPNIIGDSGFILNKRDINLLEHLIKDILERNDLDILSKIARQRIVDNYSSQNREKELVSLINQKININ